MSIIEITYLFTYYLEVCAKSAIIIRQDSVIQIVNDIALQIITIAIFNIYFVVHTLCSVNDVTEGIIQESPMGGS